MIRVLVVEDSPTLRQLVCEVLRTDSELSIVGEARNGLEAVRLCHELQPDVVTMDIRMPEMDGFEAIRCIMDESPRPVVVLTSTMSDRELGISFKAVEAGALSVIGKPGGLPGRDARADRLVAEVKVMAGVKVVRRHRHLMQRVQESRPVATISGTDAGRGRSEGRRPARIIAIGASTGGPPAVQLILQQLPARTPVPVVMVQHISKGFVRPMARWLDGSTPLRVTVAEHGETLQAGSAYLAPDDAHLTVGIGGKAALDPSGLVGGHRPSVSVLFDSVARRYGSGAAGVILTGMGRDGADGLKAMRDAGALTIAQDEGTCVVFGMPKAAIEAGAAGEVLPLGQIGARLRAVAGVEATLPQ